VFFVAIKSGYLSAEFIETVGAGDDRARRTRLQNFQPLETSRTARSFRACPPKLNERRRVFRGQILCRFLTAKGRKRIAKK